VQIVKAYNKPTNQPVMHPVIQPDSEKVNLIGHGRPTDYEQMREAAKYK
jgi:hypothetical protein